MIISRTNQARLGKGFNHQLVYYVYSLQSLHLPSEPSEIRNSGRVSKWLPCANLVLRCHEGTVFGCFVLFHAELAELAFQQSADNQLSIARESHVALVGWVPGGQFKMHKIARSPIINHLKSLCILINPRI